jgi:hypothetical protein
MRKITIISAALLAGYLSVASAQAQITYYEDNFTAGNSSPTGTYIEGTMPDTVDTNNNVWSVTTTGVYLDYQGSNYINPDATSSYTSATLPVNGTSGVNLTGLQDFTLSVNLIAGPSTPSGGGTGLTLLNGGPNGTYNGLAANLGGGQTVYVYEGNPFGSHNYSHTGNETIEFNYITNGTTGGTLQYIQNGVVNETQAVTNAQIAALRSVGFGAQGYPGGEADTVAGPAFNDFKLTIAAAPEPSTWALMLGGVLALAVVSRRRSLKA